MDRQEKKKNEGGSENGSENGSPDGSDVEDKVSGRSCIVGHHLVMIVEKP
jgi:hypothetical protein